ncbi:15332_t:CDS:1, partial [Racocetra persica]
AHDNNAKSDMKKRIKTVEIFNKFKKWKNIIVDNDSNIKLDKQFIDSDDSDMIEKFFLQNDNLVSI